MRLSFRQRVGLSMPSLVLRLLLAVVFIWAGLGKVTQTMPASGETAAALANMGIVTPAAAPTNAGQPGGPGAPGPGDEDVEEPAGEPGGPGASGPAAPEEGAGQGAGEAGLKDRNVVHRDGSRARDLVSDGGGVGVMPVAWSASAAVSATPRQSVTYTAADFPDEVRVRRMWEVALLVERAAHPPVAEDGSKPMGIWPEPLGSGPWPKWQAIAVAATQLGAGVLLVMGLLTRLSALGLMVVTAGAMWLNEIGPAIQAGDAVLGFLPNYPTFDAEAWRPLMLSFALFMTALSLFLGGPGRPSVDHALFRRRVIEDHDGL